jgi:MbtH protein
MVSPKQAQARPAALPRRGGDDVPGGAGFVVLVNADGMHSLWPNDAADPPAGWTVVPGPTGWGACLDYADRHQTSTVVDPTPRFPLWARPGEAWLL